MRRHLAAGPLAILFFCAQLQANGLNPTTGVPQNVIELPGTWRFDAAISKEFKITETKSFQLRIDCTNILNHPNPTGPNLNINIAGGANPNPFGGITSKTGTRAFQGQMRLNF